MATVQIHQRHRRTEHGLGRARSWLDLLDQQVTWLAPSLLVAIGVLGLGVIVLLASQADHPAVSASLPEPRRVPTLVESRPATAESPTFVAAIRLPPSAISDATSVPEPTRVPPTPSTAATVTSALPLEPVRLRLQDKGGRPVLFDPSVGALRQDPSLGGTNVYQVGDVFVDPRDARQWTWVGGATFVSPVGTLSFDAFRS